jgi:hypothetical protein
MDRKGLLYRIRSALSSTLGLASEEARRGQWWEIDLIIVTLLGSFMLGLAALAKLFF